MNRLSLVGIVSLAGLALTVGIGAAENRLSPPRARRAPDKDVGLDARRAPLTPTRARRHTSTSPNLLTLRRARFDVDVLIRCIEAQESGGRLHVRGDNGRSYGLYQFGRARWSEVSTAAWGSASRADQDAAMRRAVAMYLKRCPSGLSAEQQILNVAARHNGVGPKARAYAREVLLRYQGLVKVEEPARPTVSPRRESASTAGRAPGASAEKIKARR
jgi:hypothetical protein